VIDVDTMTPLRPFRSMNSSPPNDCDQPRTPPEMLAAMTSRRGITAIPACDAAVIVKVLRGVAVVSLRDAEPFELGLTWRKDDHNPYVSVLAALARPTSDSDSPGPSVADDGALSLGSTT